MIDILMDQKRSMILVRHCDSVVTGERVKINATNQKNPQGIDLICKPILENIILKEKRRN